MPGIKIKQDTKDRLDEARLPGQTYDGLIRMLMERAGGYLRDLKHYKKEAKHEG